MINVYRLTIHYENSVHQEKYLNLSDAKKRVSVLMESIGFVSIIIDQIKEEK